MFSGEEETDVATAKRIRLDGTEANEHLGAPLSDRASDAAETGDSEKKQEKLERSFQGVSEVLSFGVNAAACGLGESASLVPQSLEVFAGKPVQSISSLARHTLVALRNGAVWSFGSNEASELGRGGATAVPRPIGSLEAIPVVQVAAGDSFSCVLAMDGRVFSWGRNNHGQLGYGNRTASSRPRVIKKLLNKHVSQVAAGRNHLLCLARTGELFGTGDGNIGCGLPTGSLEPVVISHIAGAPIKKICCGESHSLALTTGGTIWSWGSNHFGQLGNSGLVVTDSYRPLPVPLDTRFQDVEAGSFHSAAVTVDGTVFTWGKNTDGQCGYSSGAPQFAPRAVQELMGTRIEGVAAGRRNTYYVTADERVLVSGAGRAEPSLLLDGGVETVFAGSFAAFAIKGGDVPPRSGIFYFDETSHEPDSVERALSTPSSVNGSFLCRETVDPSHPGIDLDRAIQVLARLDQQGCRDTIEAAFSRLIRHGLDTVTSKHPECLRLWLTCFANPAFRRPSRSHVVLDRFLVSLVGLSGRSRAIIEGWWSVLPQHLFQHTVDTIQKYVSFLVSGGSSDQSKMATAAIVLGRMHAVRPQMQYYNDTVSALVNVGHYTNYLASSAVFSWLAYPFLLNPEAKSRLVAISFKLQSDTVFLSAPGMQGITALTVRREFVLQDTMQLLDLSPLELKRPLRVVFVGEDGVDEGGPRRELFSLVLERIMDPQLGMFRFYHAAGKNWVASLLDDDDALRQYHLMGRILGLAVANAVQLPFSFPLLLYSKLLGTEGRLTLDHLATIDPELAQQLHLLLQTDSNVEDLGLTFAITEERFGEHVTVPLVENGEELAVTDANCKLYVEKYVLRVLQGAIEKQFTAMKAGWMAVVAGNPVISMLNDEELRLLVEGNSVSPVRLVDLRKICRYVEPYHQEHPVIQIFWAVVSRFSQEQARKFLRFAFGSPGVPIGGLEKMPAFTIQPSGQDPRRLPVAHTCANVLDLPLYENIEQCESKLSQAIEEGVSFALL